MFSQIQIVYYLVISISSIYDERYILPNSSKDAIWQWET